MAPDKTFNNTIAGTGALDAIEGVSHAGRGVTGQSDSNYGIRGHSKTGHAGIRGSSETGRGVEGESRDSDGVVGNSKKAGAGVIGVSNQGIGVHGKSDHGPGVEGESAHAEGVVGTSHSKSGVWGRTDSADLNSAGVFATSKHGVGIWAQGGRLGGFFDGDVEVKGDIRLLEGNDCAEDFDMAEVVEPGTVMVLGEEGALHQSHQAYDKRVAGVISGAGDYKPGIILGKHEPGKKRLPLGLLGKVYCKVDARSSPIEIGDLLTTSATPGHAMKAGDPLQAFGAVIGKALRPQKDGLGLIPILIALQ